MALGAFRVEVSASARLGPRIGVPDAPWFGPFFKAVLRVWVLSQQVVDARVSFNASDAPYHAVGFDNVATPFYNRQL